MHTAAERAEPAAATGAGCMIAIPIDAKSIPVSTIIGV